MKSVFTCRKSKCGFDCSGVLFNLLLIVKYWFHTFFLSRGVCLITYLSRIFLFFTRIEHACRIKCVNKNPFNIYLHVHVVTWVLRFSIKYLREVVSYINKTVVKTILRQILMKRFFSIWYTRVSLFRLKQILNFVS